MNKYSKTVNLEIGKKLHLSIIAKQGDTSRYLLFNILNDGIPFNLTNKVVRTWVTKPDGTKVFSDLVIINAKNGQAEMKLTSQVLAVAGNVDAELVIYKNGETLSSMAFTIEVVKSLREDVIVESTNEFGALTKALAGVNNLETNYAPRLNTVESSKAEKTYVDAKFGSMGNTKIFKGSCLFANLPISGMAIDDYWYVSDKTTNYCYNGTSWVDIGNNLSIGDNSITSTKIDRYTLPQYSIKDIGRYMERYRLEDHDANLIIPIVPMTSDNPTHLAWIDISANDRYVTGKIAKNTNVYWSKVLAFTDLNNKNIEWYSHGAIIAGVSFVNYDSTTRKFVLDIKAMLAIMPSVQRVYVTYLPEYIPTVTRTFSLSDFKFLEPIIPTIDEELILPSVIPCVIGKEMNCYWENALLYGRINTIQKIDTQHTLFNSERFRDRLIWTPTTAGKTATQVYLWKKSLKQYDISKAVNFTAVAASAGSGTKKVLVIGDSKTAYGQIVSKLKSLFDADTAMNIELLGTRYDNNNAGDVTYKHEGRSGWSLQDYCTLTTKGGITNPFYNSGFNFSNYMKAQSYTGVDYVIINLSTNDFGRTSSDVITDINTMITSIHAYNSTVNVIVCLTEGVYRDKMEWDTRNTWFINLKKDMISTYDNRTAEKIFVCPLYLNMDLYQDYNFTNVPLSAEDLIVETGKTRLMTEDGIHQNRVGFNKNADVMYYTIKYIESLR